MEQVLKALQDLEQSFENELAGDSPLPDDLRDQLRLLSSDLRYLEHAGDDKLSESDSDDRQSARRIERLSDLFDHMQLGIVALNADGIIREANPAFGRIAGKSVDGVTGQPLESLLPWKFPEYRQVLESALEGQAWNGRIVLRYDGNERACLLFVNPLAHCAGEDLVVVEFCDVTELERSHRRLRRLALHDQLTGLPNRRYYRERVRLLIDNSRRDGSSFAVCFIDLDNFKDVNDSLGHTAGDELLAQIARRLRRSADEDVFVARLGGDEFAMLIPRTDLDPRRTATVADSALRSLRKPFLLGETTARIKASIGITEYPTHTTDIDELLENADVAMYAAKSSGRNQICVFAPQMRTQVEQRNQIQQDLRRALRGNEISLRYQPLVDLRRGVLHGCEALARWRTIDGREIMPGEFVPIAESSGLIVPLGEHILVEACRQAHEWETLGVRPSVLGINISPHHLHTPDFVDRTAEILDATGVHAEWLMFEITEDGVMRDVRAAMQTMDQLVDLGLTLAIDDFGTGRSSFRYLQQFNIHVIKIDRSFINDIPSDKQACSIVESIIQLGQARQLLIVAEGIENEDQYQRLCELGCDVGQGFHIAHPLRATALECWWDEGIAELH